MNAAVTLTQADFPAFFTAVRGYPPFAWQERLLDHLLSEGRWPEGIAAPTGAGKTAVIDVHVFANALSAVRAGPRVPRRLAVVVNRRMLVDNHDEYAGLLADQLAVAEESAVAGVVAAVAAALRTFVPTSLENSSKGPVLSRTVLRGGLVRDAAWRVEPEMCSVLTCTPDMWGSRLLLRGYGTSRRARPQEAGLLAHDSVVVVDEAHLSRQLVMTARRVAQLARRSGALGEVPVLQVVDTTATPSSTSIDVVGVGSADLTASETLRQRLTRPKPVRLLPLAEWPASSGASRKAMVDVVAGAVEAIRAETAEIPRSADRTATVGCVLNRVDDAVAVAGKLSEGGLRVALLTGRMRPYDRSALDLAHPGLLQIRGHDAVDVLVATQTIEVGVDVDLAGLVTDLAPGSALAQRAGRVNRLGQRERGPVVVVVPERIVDERAVRSVPYSADDLEAARDWLEDLVDTEDGLTPWALTHEQHRPPPESPRRDVWQRLSVTDVAALSRTSEPCHAEADLSLWLADDLEPDHTVSVIFRLLRAESLAPPSESVAAFLRRTPPEEHEVVALRFGALRQLVGAYLAAGRQRHVVTPLYRYRIGATEDDASVVPLAVVQESTEDAVSIALRGVGAGDVVVLDAALVEEAKLAEWASGVTAPSAPRPSIDVYEGLVSTAGSTVARARRLRIGHLSPLAGRGWLDAVAAYRTADDSAEAAVTAATAAEAAEQARRAALAQALSVAAAADDVPEPWARALSAVQELLTGDVRDAEVVVSDEEDVLQYLVVLDRRRRLDAEVLSLTGSRDPVTLEHHQSAVASRAEASAEALGLPAALITDLRTAGLHHDDGKADQRFQHERLHAHAPVAEPLAKSGALTRQELRRRMAVTTLPRGWRHEQLSAVDALRAVGRAAPDGIDAVDAELVTRLVGTSHGAGRPVFPHAAVDLLPPGAEDALAGDLFDEGGWEALVEATDARYGVWAVAYLEALLRAADIRVSQEGS